MELPTAPPPMITTSEVSATGISSGYDLSPSPCVYPLTGRCGNPNSSRDLSHVSGGEGRRREDHLLDRSDEGAAHRILLLPREFQPLQHTREIRAREGGIRDINDLHVALGVYREKTGLGERPVGLLRRARLRDVEAELAHLIDGQPISDGEAPAVLGGVHLSLLLRIGRDRHHGDAGRREIIEQAVQGFQIPLAERAVLAAIDHEQSPSLRAPRIDRAAADLGPMQVREAGAGLYLRRARHGCVSSRFWKAWARLAAADDHCSLGSGLPSSASSK